MRAKLPAGLLAAAAFITAFAFLAYVAYRVVMALWGLFMTLLMVMVIAVTGEPGTVPPEVIGG